MAFPLTGEGKLDSIKIASEFRQFTEIDGIISSPLLRAMETAESFSSEFGLDIRTDARITEQELGKFSGMSYDEVKLAADYQQDSLKRWNWESGGVESYRMIADRVCGFLSDIEENAAGQRLLIVTHAVALRLITAALKDSLPVYPKDFPNNGEILKIEFQGLGAEHKIESIFLGNSRNFNHNP